MMRAKQITLRETRPPGTTSCSSVNLAAGLLLLQTENVGDQVIRLGA